MKLDRPACLAEKMKPVGLAASKGGKRMKIQDLADRVAAEHKVGKAEAKRIVTTVLDAITSAAREG